MKTAANVAVVLALLVAVFAAGVQIGRTRGHVIIVGDCTPHQRAATWELQCRP